MSNENERLKAKYDRLFYETAFALMTEENKLRFSDISTRQEVLKLTEMITLIDKVVKEHPEFLQFSNRMAFSDYLLKAMDRKNLYSDKTLVLKESYDLDTETVDAILEGTLKDFIRLEGTERVGSDGKRDLGQGVKIVSPLHPDYRNRSVFMETAETVLVKNSDIAKTFAAKGKGQFVETPCYLNVYDEKPIGMIYGDTDRYNLARLANYTDAKTYIELVDHIKRLPVEDFMDASKMQLTYDILEELSRRGEVFKLEIDNEPGQIRAVLDNKMSIRLTESKKDQAFVGRVYDDGLMAYFVKNKKESTYDANGKRKYITPTHEAKTAKEAMLLLDHLQGKDVVNGKLGVLKDKNGKTIYTSYHASKNYNCYVNDDYSIYVKNERYQQGKMSREVAEQFVTDALLSAKMNFKNLLDLERLKEEVYLIDQMEDGYEPEFLSDEVLGKAQRDLWEKLNEGNSLENVIEIDTLANDVVDSAFHGEKARTEQFINPILVGAYMDGTSAYANNKQLLEAMRVLGYDKDNVASDDFYSESIKEQLIYFDQSSARDLSTLEDPFNKSILEHLKATINSSGAVFKKASIDKNGIVSYEAVLAEGKAFDESNRKLVTVKGQIGQFFDKDEKGLYETKFNRTNNYYFIPGYEATIVKGEGTLEERTKLRGYEQVLFDNLASQLKHDLITLPITQVAESGERYVEIGTPTSINNTYRHLYDMRYSLDHFKEGLATGAFDETYVDALIQTASLRVKYNNYFKEGSTLLSHYMNLRNFDYNSYVNDNFTSALDLSGYRNMSLLTPEGDGYFDPIATATARNQGIVRYLDPGAKVSREGFIIKSETVGHVPMITEVINQNGHDYFMNMPFDRQIMTFSNLMKAERVAKDVGFAQMSLKGWTLEDGFVVSKAFAEKHGLDNRPLMAGDKLSDFFGNKGVINLVVDPDMSDEEAIEKGLLDEVKLFRQNPDLDLVMSSLSPLSRFNAGLAKETIDSVNATDLVIEGKGTFEGSIGRGRFIVTPMYVDEKSKVYELDDVKQGKGRKISSQLAWALNSLGANAVLDEFYARNNTAEDLKEYLLLMGADVNKYGKLSDKIYPETFNDEKRPILKLPELVYRETKDPNKKSLDKKAMSVFYGELLANEKSFVELPFNLKTAMGKDLTKTSEGKFLLPVLNRNLRQGQDFGDGTASVHNYTRRYMKILECASSYELGKARLANKALSASDKKQAQKMIDDAMKSAQNELNAMSADIEGRKFLGKNNLFKNDLMSQRVARSATAVWTGDPRLNINEVGLGPEMAKSLGVKDGQEIQIWRDPILMDQGVKFMKVKINPDLHSLAINPVLAKAFQGDFDGDSVGATAMSSKAARNEARLLYSVGATLLDKSVAPDKEGNFPLSIHTDLDFKFVSAKDEDFKTRLANNILAINEVDKIYQVKNKALAQKDNLKTLNDLIHEGFDKSFAEGVVSYKDLNSHIESLDKIIQTGAKGSYSKFKDYLDYYGISGEVDNEKGINYDSLKLEAKPNISRSRICDVQYAVTVKTEGTGIAGAVSQRGVKGLRNSDIKAVLEMTYPVSQSVLQSKHSAIEAAKRLDALMSGVGILWGGNLVEKSYDNGEVRWQKASDEAVITKDTWVKNAIDFYTDPDGLNVNINPEMAERLGEAITKNGMVQNIRDLGKEAPIMDRMAYGGNLEVLHEACKKGENLYDGEWNKHFAPKKTKALWAEVLAKKESVKSGFDKVKTAALEKIDESSYDLDDLAFDL